MHTIGISFGYHDSSIAILKDSEIVAIYSEERFSRIKHDKGFPQKAWQYAINKHSLNNDNIAQIIYYENAQTKHRRIRQQFDSIMEYVQYLGAKFKEDKLIAPIDEIIQRTGVDVKKVKCTDHHLSHFAAALCMREKDVNGTFIGITIDGVENKQQVQI